MVKAKRDLSKIIHVSKDVHNKLKRYVTSKQLNDQPTSLSLETEIAIKNHIRKKS